MGLTITRTATCNFTGCNRRLNLEGQWEPESIAVANLGWRFYDGDFALCGDHTPDRLTAVTDPRSEQAAEHAWEYLVTTGAINPDTVNEELVKKVLGHVDLAARPFLQLGN